MNRSELLIDTLDSFGISAQVDKIEAGPTVTTYTLKPARGVRFRDIASLKAEISFALGAKVRINDNVIEVPNERRSIIQLTDMLDDDFQRTSPLSVALGADNHGKDLYIDIAKLPHLLIAGQTGSGKSSCLHSIMLSLLSKRRDDVRLVMIDTKRVESARYRGVKNVTVVNYVSDASEWLSEVVRIMRNRYALLDDCNAGTIAEYNEKRSPEQQVMGTIVIIIDEFEDLMMSDDSGEIHELVCSIARLGRACGIHLIIATQRPSVKVITGQIKANIPARIAFKTASSVDSRVIIDRSGAETLLGAGDGLLVSDGETKRFQGAYISADDMQRCIDRLK